MSDPVKIAMVGAGGMANNVHYPSLASFDDVVFAGICDLDEARMNTTADKFGIEHRFTDYRLMVEEVAPDGIYVIGQPHYMAISGSLNEMKWVKVPWFLAWGRG